MFRIITTLSVGLALMVTSCATSKIISNTQYQYSDYKDPSLVIVLKDEPQVDYEGNVKPEFGPGDPIMLIRNFFKTQLIEDIKDKTVLKNIEIGQCTSDGSFEKREIESGEAGSEIEALVNGGQYSCQKPDPAYVLVLSEISIRTSYQNMGMGGSSKNLTYRAKAFLYDNRAKQFVEYGLIDESALAFFPVITISVWKNASAIFTEKLFVNTKLIKPEQAVNQLLSN